MKKPKIFLSSPHMGGNEQNFVNNAFETNWISPLGPHVDGFEADLASYTGSKHVAALSAGTAAIHLALILLGVERGDEVICSSFTFSASANPIAYQGAIPVFVDCEESTWNMSPVALEEALKDRIAKGKKPKAVIDVHLYGMPSHMDEIVEICERYDVPLIEDAAEALGSRYKGKHMGTFGVLGILSFNGNKIITTSGGGALMSDNEALISKARFLATQARDNAPHYQHSHIGYNYRLSNIAAAIGRGQMQVLDDRVKARRANYDRYQRFFASVPGIRPGPSEPEGMFSNRWLSTIRVNPAETGGLTREDIRLGLLEENIESRPLWKPMHLQPVFEGSPYYGDRTSEKLFDDGLCLPCGSNLSEEEWQRIEESLERIVQGKAVVAAG